ncbi:hypothetical protein K488DRAFT_74698 [Vararia minispora EC-137]|uniref:Uncharacterized protein n=1 Tax=Vararia minispora EC-137 TaxID=1314806 RepID=A0ACB8Q6H9_9AGAM|nr:hypothetical protein K488DRAFT_74698 [Vararia minispora EC-137]
MYQGTKGTFPSLQITPPHLRHEDYLRIVIEDTGNYANALAYLRRLGPSVAEHNLARYGRKMLGALPDETTQLLIDICTDPATLRAVDPELQSEQPAAARQQTSYLAYLNLNRAPAPAAEQVPDAPDAASRKGSIHEGRRGSIHEGRRGSVHEGRKDSIHDGSSSSTPPPGTPTTATATAPRVPAPLKRPSPQLYFANFVGHRAAFVVFLETVARRRWGQTVDGPVAPERPGDEDDAADQAAVWNTLLELYLAGGLTVKAQAVLESASIPYDAAHALMLCGARGYTRGTVLLWGRLGMHEDVLRFWIARARAGEAGAGAEIMRVLRAHGNTAEAARVMYPLTLRFFSESADAMARHRAELAEVLDEIQQRAIMPPLAVVQVLSRNGAASVGAVKEWLLARVREARAEVETDRQLTESYRAETAAKVKKVAELSDPDAPRNFHVTTCASCGGQLDLPSVHFMCGHSYHQRCLINNETECPHCAREHAVIRDIRRNNERLADQHDVFVQDVREGGFGVLAAGFGRGVFNTARIEEVGAR